MPTRREFLSQSAAAIAALGIPSTARAAAPPSNSFGVQLYTVRKQILAAPQPVLAAIQKIGYRSVETFAAQYHNTSAKDLRSMITDAGLTLPSAHFSYDDISTRFDYAAELGVKYVVCGSEARSLTDSLDGFKRAAEQYNLWGEQARKVGLQFAFHNHNIEFQSFNGVTGLDTLLKHTEPRNVHWQIDCYWVTQAGFDPVDLMRRYRKRLQTLHVKDRKPGFPPSTNTGPGSQHFTEAGGGTINWEAIWRVAETAHIPYFFVEQDTTEIPPLDSLKISYDNLKRILV